MAIFPAFVRLAKAIDRHLLPALDELGFREIEREPEWWGGHITYERHAIELRLAYETHDAGLMVRLGKTKLGTPGPEYRLYSAAAGIESGEFVEACGGRRPGYLQVQDFEKAFAFVAATLPVILPRQAVLQQEIEEQQQAAERERQRLERNSRRRASRKRPT